MTEALRPNNFAISRQSEHPPINETPDVSLRSGASAYRWPRWEPISWAALWERSIPEPNSGCWIWLGGTNTSGYPVVKVRKLNRLVTRMVLALDGRPAPAGLLACHRCDVRCCVNPAHLFAGTHKENTADMHAKGRGYLLGPRGKPPAVRSEALRLYRSGLGQKAIGQRLGLPRSTVHGWITKATSADGASE